MKKLITQFAVIIYILTIYSVNAEQINSSEGKEFWFGIPFADKSSDETLWGSETNSPYELFITSKENTTVRIYIGGSNLYKTVSVIANRPMVVAIPDGFMNVRSEVVQSLGLYVNADDPVEVSFYISWQWTGELFKVLPLRALGNNYFTLNMYQDYNKDHAGSSRYHPSQILIVATEDSTDVTYTPTYETQRGVIKDSSRTVRLNKGQTFNIMGKLDSAYNQSWVSDLTGTNIVSSKPIAVFSGHTKGCFPMHSSTMLGLKADFMRNLLIEPMLPVNALGTEYVSVPILYTGRTSGYGTKPDDRGDLIRFVATEDNTIIQRMRDDGLEFENISDTLNKGQDFKILNCETPGYYKSNKPILVGQYGKAWWMSAVHAKIDDNDKEGDELMNPPKCGQGMMMGLIPNYRWINNASFNSPKGGMYNYVNIICKTIDTGFIYFDNRVLKEEFGSKLKRINGTPYSYVSSEIHNGGHTVSTTNDSTNFAVYFYGNLDGPKDGFAYGGMAGINVFTPCQDTVTINEIVNCNITNGTINAVDLIEGADCAGIYNVTYNKTKTKYAKVEISTFSIGDNSASFEITFRDNRTDTVEIIIQTMSNNVIRKQYTYSLENISLPSDTVSYPISSTGDVFSKTLTIKNEGYQATSIKRLYFNSGENRFYIQGSLPANYILPANESVDITVSFAMPENNIEAFQDELWAESSCSITKLAVLKANPAAELITTDIDFDTLTPSVTIEKEFSISNSGLAQAEITGLFNVYSETFTVQDAIFPITILPNETKSIKVKFTPVSGAGINYTDTLYVVTSTTESKLYSALRGYCQESNESARPLAPQIPYLAKDDNQSKLVWVNPTRNKDNSIISSIIAVDCYVNSSYYCTFTGEDIAPAMTNTRYIHLPIDRFSKINLSVIAKNSGVYDKSTISINSFIYRGTPLQAYSESFDSYYKADKIALNGNWGLSSAEYVSGNYSLADNFANKTPIADYNFDFAIAPITIDNNNYILNFANKFIYQSDMNLLVNVYVCSADQDVNNIANYTKVAEVQPEAEWNMDNVNLQAYNGQSIYVVFKMTSSMDQMQNETSNGVYFDDIVFTNQILGVEDNNTQNYTVMIQPNPTNENAEIKLNLTESGNINIELYNSNGEIISNVYNDYITNGEYNLPISLKNLSNGKYFVRVKFGDSIKDYSLVKMK